MEKDITRIKYIDIAKGIGIILIVWAHAHGPFAANFLLLGVALFFIISGILHNSERSFNEFFKRKFYRLYVPFVCCNLFLPILTLLKRNSLGLEIKYNIIYIIKIILTIDKDGFLFGATWFIGSLFLITIFTKFLETIFKSNKKYLYTGLICLCLISLSYTIPSLDYGIRRTIIGAFLYYIGMVIVKYKDNYQQIFSNHYLYIPVIIIFSFLWNKLPLFSYKNTNILFLTIFILCSILFYLLIIRISKLLEKYIQKISTIFSYIGTYSFHILIWHFVFFEIITGFILNLNNIPITLIERYPHVVCENTICFLIYFITGLIGPLLTAICYKYIYNILKKRVSLIFYQICSQNNNSKK